MNKRHILLAVTLPLLCAAVLAQAPGAHWTLTPTPSDPPQRRENPGVSDGTYMYVFGGQSGGSGGVPLNDLWRFDGVSWSQMTADGAPGSPPARDMAGVTWDFARNRLVVFGGQDLSNNKLGDTWEWDPTTNTWADVSPPSGPSARQWCALAYDYVNQKVLLFGGLDSTSTHLNDTWLFDGLGWVSIPPSGSIPPARRQHVLVERPDFQDIIMTAGQDTTGPGYYGDTWKWDGASWSWTQITTTTSPAGKASIDAAYDQIRQRIVIAGGAPGPQGAISEFDSLTNDWVIRPLDPGIYKVTRYFMAYVPALGRTYKVSGQSLNAAAPPQNTYEYQTSAFGTFSTSGTGCAGGAGVPTHTVSGAPWLGRTVSIGVANVAANEEVTLLLSPNDQTWLGWNLPLDLTPLGIPGCTVYVNPEILIPLGVGAAAGTWNLYLPDVPSLVGVNFFTQGVLVDLTTGAFGLTEKGTGTIGIL